MKGERAVWWIFFTLFVIEIVLGILIFPATVATHPEAAAFLLGITGFLVFSNRLIFGYGSIVDITYALLQGKEVDREKLETMSKEPAEKVKDLSILSLITLWKNSLEPYKYSYYLAFFIVLIVTILFQLNITPSYLNIIAEALMLGAAVPTVIVWGLDNFSAAYLDEAIKKALR